MNILRKISLFCLLTSSVFSADPQPLHPKLYQSLWPNFCHDHLLEGKGCSEIDFHQWPSFWDDEDNEFFVTPFFARTKVNPDLLPHFQTLIKHVPALSEPCAYVYCALCGQPVKKSIGLYGQEVDFDYFVMYHACDCLHAARRLDRNNYAIYDDLTWHTCKQSTIPFVYFNRFTSQYHPFLKHHLELCKENPQCDCYWPYVSALACSISDLVYDCTHDLFQNPRLPTDDGDAKKLFRDLFQNPRIPTYMEDSDEQAFYQEHYPHWRPELKEEFILRALQNHFIFAFFYSNYHTIILNLCNYVDSHSLTAPQDLHKLYSTLSSIRPLFLQLYSSCLAKHPHPKIFYERGMVHFHNGDLFAALSDMRSFTDLVDDDTLLSSDFYLQEGTSYAELGLYDEAVEALTKSIAKNPHNEEAYFERASLYFEMGDFKRSIQDYLESGFSPTPLEAADFSSIAFATHLMKGVAKGSTHAATGFLPSLMASARGLSHCLWAFASAPVHCSQEMVSACKALLDFLSQGSSRKLLEALIPELGKLDACSSHDERVELLGFIIGKYGTEIFAPAGLLHVYKNLRSANRVLTLSRLAMASEETVLLKKATTNWNKAHLDLIQTVKAGEKALTIYHGQYLPETTVRKILHELDIPTFPKPQGIPENFRITFSDRGCGMKYVHPNNTGTYVRIMPGKPYSPNPLQQQPYINHRINGRSMNKSGRLVDNDSPEAHIPVGEFTYRNATLHE